MPVTRRAGVTSKPGLCAALPAGVTRTCAAWPAAGHARDRRDLVGRALFDRDAVRRALDRPVDRRRGRRDVERNAAVARGQRLQVRADLVDDVAGRRRPVRADEDDVDLARAASGARPRCRRSPCAGRRARPAPTRSAPRPGCAAASRRPRRGPGRPRRAPRRRPPAPSPSRPSPASPRCSGSGPGPSPCRRRADVARSGARACSPIARLMATSSSAIASAAARAAAARASGRQRRQARRQCVERPAQVDRRGPRRQQRRARRLQRGVATGPPASPARSRTPPPRRSGVPPAPASWRSRSRPRRPCAAGA